MTAASGSPPLGRAYVALWWSAAVSNLGTGVTLIALPLLVDRRTDDPLAFGLLAAAAQAPGVLAALPSGLVADRRDRRQVMIVADIGRMAILGLLAAAVAIDRTDIAVLCLAAAGIGALDVFFRNSSRAMLPAIVPAERLDAANGRLVAADDIILEFVGPPLAVALFAVAPALPFTLDAATYAGSALLLLAIRGSFRPATTVRDGGLAEAARWIRGRLPLRRLAWASAVLPLCSMGALALLLPLVRGPLDGSRGLYGTLVVVLAVGSALGSLAAERVVRRAGPGRALVGAVALNAVSYAVVGVSHSPLVVGAALAAWGASISVGMVVSLTLRAQLTPDAMRGRVFAVIQMAVSAGAAVGALGAGALARATSLDAAYAVLAAVQLALVPLLVPALRSRALAEVRAAAGVETT